MYMLVCVYRHNYSIYKYTYQFQSLRIKSILVIYKDQHIFFLRSVLSSATDMEI